jgi:hypothetical protein
MNYPSSNEKVCIRITVPPFPLRTGYAHQRTIHRKHKFTSDYTGYAH